MKKRFFAFLMTVVILALLLSVGVSAETAAEESFIDETFAAEVPDSETNAAESEADTILGADASGKLKDEVYTFFGRVLEYAEKYKVEILGVVGDMMIFIVVVVLKGAFKRKNSAMSDELAAIKGHTATAKSQQSAMVGAMNQLIDGYNAMKGSYDKYESVEDDRNKLVGAVMVQNTAILDILQTVYANSKNLPQGVKDVITLKYANALRALGEDKTLAAIVEAVHEKVGQGASAASGGEDA